MFVLCVLNKDKEKCRTVKTKTQVRMKYKQNTPPKKPGGGETFRIRPDRPWGPPSLPYNRYGVIFPGGKAAGAWL